MEAKPDAPRKQPLYFINAPIDFALVGGISIAAYFFVTLVYGRHDRSDPAIRLGQQLMWVCNWPHFAATSYRLYHSRENIRQYPLTALVIPWLILAAVAGSIVYPETIAPYFIMTFLIWSPYHFSGQTVGISMIYARRAGFFVGKVERLALSGFIFGTFLSQTIRAEVDPRTLEYYQIKYPTLGLPMWTAVAAETAMYFAGVVLLLCVLRWCVQNKRILPPIVLLPAVSQYVWFVLSANWPSFNEFVPFFHSLQYMLIAWSMQLKEKMDRDHIAPSKWYVLSESLRWGSLNFVGGIFLFFLFPMALTRFFRVPEALSLGVTAAAVQIHHFFVDGVIWKLKRKTVASPLMVNIDELISPAAHPVPIIAGTPAAAMAPSLEQKV